VIEKLRSSQSFSPAQPGPSDPEIPLLSQSMLDTDTVLIDVLEQQVAEIVAMIREIDDLFSKTLSELQNSRHVLTTIEASTTTAVAEMQNGNVQLEQETENQKTRPNALAGSQLS
jgi:hypothetical protein